MFSGPPTSTSPRIVAADKIEGSLLDKKPSEGSGARVETSAAARATNPTADLGVMTVILSAAEAACSTSGGSVFIERLGARM